MGEARQFRDWAFRETSLRLVKLQNIQLLEKKPKRVYPDQPRPYFEILLVSASWRRLRMWLATLSHLNPPSATNPPLQTRKTILTCYTTSVNANTKNANARKDRKIAVAAEANHTIVPQSAKRGVNHVTIADSITTSLQCLSLSERWTHQQRGTRMTITISHLHQHGGGSWTGFSPQT